MNTYANRRIIVCAGCGGTYLMGRLIDHANEHLEHALAASDALKEYRAESVNN